MSLITSYVDGACRNWGKQPNLLGQGALGVVIFRNDQLIGQYARALGPSSNNAAEFEALIHGLLLCWSADLRDPNIYSDSQLVVNQVNRAHPCRSPELQPLLSSVWEIQKEFRFRLQHTPRTDPGIQRADQLCNLMLDQVASEWSQTPLKRPRRRQRRPTTPGEPRPS